MYIVSLFAVPIAKGVTIDVWIQEEIIAGGLVFKDGSPFTTDFDTFSLLIWATIQLKHAFKHVAPAHFNSGVEVKMYHPATCVNTSICLLFEA